MSKVYEYYTKPRKVEAHCWKGQSDFFDHLKDSCQITEYTIETPPMSIERGDLREFRAGSLEVKYVRYNRVNGIATVTLEDGDWLVIDDGKISFLTSEEFRKHYFFTSTETKKTLPTLEELL